MLIKYSEPDNQESPTWSTFIVFKLNSNLIYIYIYIYICVCVCE